MTDEERARLGQHIKVVRNDKGISLRDLEQTSGISRGRLSEIESGQRLPRPAALSRIAAALEIDWEDLYALAGYGHPEGLPSFGPYLRSRYGSDLTAEQVADLERHFRDLTDSSNEGDS